jgi:plasmid stability protein
MAEPTGATAHCYWQWWIRGPKARKTLRLPDGMRYNAIKLSNDSIRRGDMAALTVRNLDDAIVRRLRIRAAEHGRSAEAEHREILRTALTGAEPPPTRQQAADRLTEFRQRTAGRGTPKTVELLAESRAGRLQSLVRNDT